MSKVWTDSSCAKPHRDSPADHLEHSVQPRIVSDGWVGRERVRESSVLPLAVGQALILCCGALSLAGTIEVNADRDERGNSLLLTAAQNGLKRIVKLLLRKGADINARVCGKQPPPWPPPPPSPPPALCATSPTQCLGACLCILQPCMSTGSSHAPLCGCHVCVCTSLPPELPWQYVFALLLRVQVP